MLKFDTDNKSFEDLVKSDLIHEQILERYDFQKAIVNSWDTFRNRINLPSSYLIGQEITPHGSVKDSIDLLAFNPDDSSLIVIELKRSKNKLQLLQALSYAAMIATWDNDKLISEIQRSINPEPEELIDLINNNELNSDIKIVLISELYDPEVIITSEWLYRMYSCDISAFALSLHKFGEETFVHFEQRLPLKEVADIYEERGRKYRKKKDKPEVTWEDVIPKLKYSFGRKAVEVCLTEKEGEPSRRRFSTLRKNYDGFDYISIHIRENYIKIYLTGKPEGAEKIITSKFSSNVEISSWADGYSVKIISEEQLKDMIKWLNLGKKLK